MWYGIAVMKPLILAVFFTIMHASPPVPRQAANNPTRTPNATQNQSNPNQTPPAAPISVVDATAPQKDRNSSRDVQGTIEQKSIVIAKLPTVSVEKDWRDKTYWFFTFLIVVITAIEVCLLWRTLKFVRVQSVIMRRQTAIIARQARSMRFQTTHLKNAAKAAALNSQALINSERAWVIAELIPICTQFSQGRWARPIGERFAALSDKEIRDGEHLKHTIKLTNMGRTPAHILRYEISYTCLGEGVVTASGEAIAKQESARLFDRLIGATDSIEAPETVDVNGYMLKYIEGINQLKNTALFHGWVEYQHVFSESEVVRVRFCYVYRPSISGLERVPEVKVGTGPNNENRENQPPN